MKKSALTYAAAASVLCFGMQTFVFAAGFLAKADIALLDKTAAEQRSAAAAQAIIPSRLSFFGAYTRAADATADALGMPLEFSISGLSVGLEPFSTFLEVKGTNISGRFGLTQVKTENGIVYAEAELFSRGASGGTCGWAKEAVIKLSLRMDKKGVIDQNSPVLSAWTSSTVDNCHSSPEVNKILFVK